MVAYFSPPPLPLHAYICCVPSSADLHVRTVVSGMKIKMSKPYAEPKIVAKMIETSEKRYTIFRLFPRQTVILLICIKYYSYV